MDGAKTVTIFGEKVAVRAKVFTIGGLSAHADQADLLGWVGHFAEKARPRVFVIHGEPMSSEALAGAIRKRFNLDVYVPHWREVLSLERREGPREILPEAFPVDVRQDMITLTTDLEAEIVRLRQRLAASERAFSELDVEKLRDIRDDLQSVVSG